MISKSDLSLKLALRHGIPEDEVISIANAYWKMIKEHMDSLDLRNMSEEELDSLQCANVRLRNLGKLFINKDIIKNHLWELTKKSKK